MKYVLIIYNPNKLVKKKIKIKNTQSKILQLCLYKYNSTHSPPSPPHTQTQFYLLSYQVISS